MVKGGVEAEIAVLLGHVDGVAQPSVARVAARGVVGILARGCHPNPTHAIRRCLVGVPCACVDEISGSAADLVTAGVIDANAMIGELFGALAANAASSERPADGFSVNSEHTKSASHDPFAIAAALVRGIGLVVAASMGGSGTHDPNSEAWAGPQHPLAKALRTDPHASAAPTLDAIATILGYGPDGAAARSRAPPAVAFARLRSFLRHALLSDAYYDSGFRQSLHARLVRICCTQGPLQVPAAALLGKCLPWYRRRGGARGGTQGQQGRDASAHDAWIATACGDVADALETAISMTENEQEIILLTQAAKAAARGVVGFLSDEKINAFTHRTTCLGTIRRLLSVATSYTSTESIEPTESNQRWISLLACDLASLVPSAFERNAGEAGALVSLLARFFSNSELSVSKTKEVSSDSTYEHSSLVNRHSAYGAVIAARVSSAMGLPPAKGGRLAATLATPPMGKSSANVKEEIDRKASSTFTPCDSADAALAHALEPLWLEGDHDADSRLLQALDTDGAVDEAKVAFDRRRRRRRLNQARENSSVETSTASVRSPSSIAPPLLPLVLLAHPSNVVRQAAANHFARRITQVPQRAPASLPPLLGRLRAACGAANETVDATTAQEHRDEAKVLLAGLHAVAAGAAHPLGAPVALRALAPLVDPIENSDSKSSQFFPTSKPPDANVHALALRLLAELWRHHRGVFPRLKAALEQAASSRSPEVVIGAAAAVAYAAAHDPHSAVELAQPLRECLKETAPAPATALALEAIGSLCDADALDFYAALKVVVSRKHLHDLPKDPLVASRWVRLLGCGRLDAAARPAAAAAAVAAAFAATTAGISDVSEYSVDTWVPTRVAALEALARYDCATLLEPPALGDDEEGEVPCPGSAIAQVVLNEPSQDGKVIDAGVQLLIKITTHERKNIARWLFTGQGAGERRDGTNTSGSTSGAKERVTALAAADSLLHKVTKNVQRRLRTMPRLAGGASDRLAAGGGTGVGPAGSGAHLLLFRPTDLAGEEVEIVEVEEEGDEDAKTKSKRLQTDDKNTAVRSNERRAALRIKADAHRRAFRTVANSLQSPPKQWHWHTNLTHKTWARFTKRWLDAEVNSVRGVSGTEFHENENESVIAEARLSVFSVAIEHLKSDAPDVVQNAAAVLTAPCMCVPSISEKVVDVLTERLAGDKHSPPMDGCERNACLALGVAGGSLHSSDKERREKVVNMLNDNIQGADTDGSDCSNTSGTTVADPSAAAEALGMFARRLGADLGTDGPGAGAWRVELLCRSINKLKAAFTSGSGDNNNPDNNLNASGFASGFVYAAVATDAAARAGVKLDDVSPFGDENSETNTTQGSATFAALGVLTVILEDGVNKEDGNEKASAAARAVPIAAAAALVAGAPADALVLRALRAATRGAQGHEHHKESLRVACLASVGALLDVALAAGVATPRPDVASAVASLAAPLTHPSGTSSSAATHASAALGLAAAIGGSWCLAGIRENAPNAGLAAFAAGGKRASASENHSECVSTPLLWGCEFGASLARTALKTLEAAASAEGTAAAVGGLISLRAREQAAWGLALVANAAVARAGASSVHVAAKVTDSKAVGQKNTSSSMHTTAIGTLTDAALSDDANAPPLAAARALRVLAHLDRLPSGDWPGALRRLMRRAAALESSSETSDRLVAHTLSDACAALAANHPGPAVGGAFLETTLGDLTANSLPPTAVLRKLGQAVSALPPNAAHAALRAVVAAAADASRKLKGDSDHVQEVTTKLDALWHGLVDAGTPPARPWAIPAIISAACELASALRRPDGAEMISAVNSIKALKNANPKLSDIGRATARSADDTAPFQIAEAFRTKLVANETLHTDDFIPLVAWNDENKKISKVNRFGALVPVTSESPLRVKTRILNDAIDDSIEAIAAVTDVYAAIGLGNGVTDLDNNASDFIFAAFPVSAAAVVDAFRASNDAGAVACASSLASSIFNAAVKSDSKNDSRNDSRVVRSKQSATAAARLLRLKVSDELWEQNGWRLE